MSNPKHPWRHPLRWGVLLAIGSLMIVATLSVASRRTRQEVIQPRFIQPADDCALLPSDVLLPMPVSLASLDGDRCLVCNYSVVQTVNLRTGAASTVAPPREVEHWCPTGLCVAGTDGTVVLANYTGHDLLEMRLCGDRFELVRRITHPDMVSPENVAVSEDGQLLAVADYDGDRLLVFHRDGELAWSRPVGNAHGVAFGPDGIVVSGLKDRRVTLFDLRGNRRRETGGFGWGAGKYLWPTCVTHAAGRYLVSDAHTGRITILDRELKPVDWFGGNGPGAALFNMPYAVTVLGKEVVVCDTFKGRVLRLDEKGKCHAVLTRERAPLRWALLSPSRERRQRGYLDPGRRTPATLPGLGPTVWTPGYWGFDVTDGRHSTWMRYPDCHGLFNLSAFPYLCWCLRIKHTGGRYLLLGHSQDTRFVVVDEAGRAVVVEANVYLWRVAERLYTDNGTLFDPAAVVAEAAGKLRDYDRLVRERSDPITAARVFWPQSTPEELRRRIEREFVSPAGKEFWMHWQQAKGDEGRRVAGNVFDAALRRGAVGGLQEVFMKNLLVPGAAGMRENDVTPVAPFLWLDCLP
jgi:hypothetical protein